MNLFGHDLLALMASHGYLVLFVIVMVEEAGLPLPIPGDLLLLITGSLVTQGVLGLAPTLLVLAIATLIGTSFLYDVALRGGRPLLRRYGRWLRLKEERVDRAERWLGKRPISGIVLLRLTPGLRISSTLVAGLLGVPRARATISLVVSGVVWGGTWLGLGMALGTNVNRAADMISRVDRLVLPALAVVLASLGVVWLGRRAYRRYLPQGLLLRVRHPLPAKRVSRPRLGNATFSAIVVGLLLVSPPLIWAVHTISERVEQEVEAQNAALQSHPILLIDERWPQDFRD